MFRWCIVFYVFLSVSISATNSPCHNIQFYIEFIKGISYINCSYQATDVSITDQRLLRCDYDSSRHAVTISPSAAVENTVDMLANGVFRRLLSAIKEIREVAITHLTVHRLTRRDFIDLRDLNSLTLMFPRTMDEDIVKDIASSSFFQLYFYCNEAATGYSDSHMRLIMTTRNWHVILRHCRYTLSCQQGNILYEYYVLITPIHYTLSESTLKNDKCMKTKLTPGTKVGTTTTTGPMTRAIKASTMAKLMVYGKVHNYTSTSGQVMEIVNAGSTDSVTLITLFIVGVNVLVIFLIVLVAVYKYNQRKDCKPCRGKHTIVLYNDRI